MAQGSSQQPQQERRDQPQPPGGPFVVAQEPSGSQSAGPMDTGSGVVLPGDPRPEPPGVPNPKRPRLLLDRPRPGEPGATPSPSASPGGLYPPGFAGVREVHGDVSEEDLAGFAEWDPSLKEAMGEESELAAEYLKAEWDQNSERPPNLSAEDLAKVDAEAGATEIRRLLEMGVVRWPKEGEVIEGYQSLTTKTMRDWRQRPGWVRRSRLVGREFKTLSPYSQELFAPASTLARSMPSCWSP